MVLGPYKPNASSWGGLSYKQTTNTFSDHIFTPKSNAQGQLSQLESGQYSIGPQTWNNQALIPCNMTLGLTQTQKLANEGKFIQIHISRSLFHYPTNVAWKKFKNWLTIAKIVTKELLRLLTLKKKTKYHCMVDARSRETAEISRMQNQASCIFLSYYFI